MNGIPHDWYVSPLSDVVDILDRKRIPVNAKERQQREGDIPYFGATGQVGWIDDYLFDEELVLLGEDGAPFLDFSKQKAYIIQGKSWVNNHAHVLKSSNGLPNSYIKYYLDTVDYRPFVTGTTRLKLNQAAMKQIPVPIAPGNHPKRIVEEIEKQFSRLDEAVANLKRVKANLKRYKASVLQAAVTGKLTEAWRKNNPDVEPASKLLERILTERRQKWEETELAKLRTKGKDPKNDKWKEKYKEPEAPSLSDLPELPNSWVWVGPEQLASTNKYSLAIGPFGSNLKVSDYAETGVPLVFVRNIRSEAFGGSKSKFVSRGKAEELSAHSVNGGDILITKMGAPPGDACIYPDNLPMAIITADCIKWAISTGIRNKKLFVNALNSQLIAIQIAKITKGVAQQKISLARFKSVALPLSSVEEQQTITQEVESRLSVAEEIERTVETNLKRAERLRQSILKQAFSGKLV